MKQKLLKLTLLLCILIVGGNTWAETTYKLQQVTSVEAGGLYVFEQDGYVMNNTCSSSALQTTNSYNTTGLTGAETYVWTLESATDGYYMKNVNGTGSNPYLKNASKTNVGFDTKGNASIWTFNFQEDNSVLIQNKSNSDRFLGYTNATSHAYKAYATSNMNDYPHAIKVYQLVEESSSPASPLASITVDASRATTVFHIGDEFTHEGAVVTATYEDGSSKDVTADATFSTPDMTTASNQTVTISYTENEIEKETSYEIEVKAPATLESITLSGTYPTEFTQGDDFSSEGIVVTANYDDKTTKNVTDEVEFSGYDMTVAGEQTVIVSYEGKSATYTITVNEYVMPSELTIDFESALSTYKEWEFTNAERGTESIKAHNGEFYGTTGGKTTASIQTKEKVANPGTFTCYVSKQSTNTTSSTWSIQVSSDASSWTDVNSQSATSMSKGEWVEFTADLSSYNNIYVRLYYNGSTAIRNVDDITLEMATPQVLSSIALSGEYPTTFHQGDDFSHEGMTVTATYESGKTADVTEDVTFSGYDMNVVGEQTVTVSYTENEVTKTATYSITVNAPATLTGIALSGTYPTEFQQGDAFSSEGIVVTASYDDNTTADVTDEATFSDYDMNALGEQTVTVSYSEGEVTKSATYTITVVEKKGTSDNPYTVAEACAAIDAGAGIQGVYATGIVSEIVTAYNSQYGNITFDIVDEGDASTSLRAYRCAGSEAENVQVGDVVVVSGNLTKYNDIYEFAQGCEIVSLQHPVITTPYIEVAELTVEAPAEGAEGTINVTYGNITDVVAEILFSDAEGNEASYEDWLIAEINSKDNNIYYLIDENTTTEARTAYMKVHALDDDGNDVYSELITVTQEGVVIDYATLPLAFDGKKADLPAGFTQEGLGTDYSASPYLKFDGTGDCLILKINERPGKLTFDIKGNSFSDGTFTVQTSEDGETYTDLKKYKAFGSSLHSESFNGLDENVRYIKWIYTEKANGNVALGNIKLDKYYEPISLTLNASGFATFASTEALDFSDFETAGYTAWQATSTDGETIKFEQIKTAVAAGTGILLSGEAGAAIELNAASEGEDLTGTNLLVGFTEATAVADDEYFGLSGDEFVKVKAGTVPAGKALLPASVSTSVKSFSFAFEGNATGIKSLSDSPLQGETIFNLAGQRLQKIQKGINIVNGKKVLY